jgi:SNF2 family DNA or RNA helicase
MYIMKTKPWEHQLKALDYLMVRDTGALYTDMGSGKTKVGIDLIINKGFSLTVIVGTKKSCDVWEQEFKTHMDRANICVFKLSNYSTTDKVTKLKEKTLYCHKNGLKLVIIINYDSIWRKPFSEKLIQLPIDCVICDESHRIKTPSSKCSLYLNRLGKRVKNKYLFTGTPLTSTPLDVYAQYRFLDSSIFGTRFDVFRDRYENVDTRKSMYAGFRILDAKKPYIHLDELEKKMFSCAFQVTPDIKLPEVTDIKIEFEPSRKLIQTYKELHKEGVYVDDIGVLETNNALSKALREQQLLSGYMTMDNHDFTGEKLTNEVDHTRRQVLEDLLDGIKPTEKVVVFAKFRYDFDEIKAACELKNRLYGEISGHRDDYSAWKSNKIDVIAVQYSSGAESISLVEARYCIYYSLSNYYGLYKQSRKRVHRPGQDRPVTYYHMICKIPKLESIDEKIIKALELKQDLVDYLMSQG